MRELLERIASSLLAFLVAFLPERVKERRPWKDYRTTAAHVSSGVVELGFGVVLFGMGYLSFVGEFSAAFGFDFATKAPNPTTSSLGRLGILGFVSYLLTPWAMITFFCVVEGVLRALDAILSERFLGMAFVSGPHWLWLRLRERSRRADLAVALGPARPDRIEHPDATPDGSLRIFSRDDKPWSDVQVVEFEEHFYLLVEKGLVPEQRWWSYRYKLRAMDPREIIRGTVVRYEPSPAAPPSAEDGADGEEIGGADLLVGTVQRRPR